MRNGEYTRKFRSYAARRYCWIQNESLVDRLERMAAQKRIVAYYRQFELESEFRQAPLKLYSSGYDLHANLQSAIAHKLQMVYIPGLVRDKVFKNYLEKYYENRIYLDFWRLTRRIKACFRGNAAVAKQVSLAELVKKDKKFKKNRLLKSDILNQQENKKPRKSGRSQNKSKSGKYKPAKSKNAKNKQTKRGFKNQNKMGLFDLNLDFLDRQTESPVNITGLLNNMSRIISKSNIELDVLQLPDPKVKLSFMNLPRRTPDNSKPIGRLLSLGNTLVTSHNNFTVTRTGTSTSSRLNNHTPSNQRSTPTPQNQDFPKESQNTNRSESRASPHNRLSLSRKPELKSKKPTHVISLSDCRAFEIKNEKDFENYSTSPFSPTDYIVSKKKHQGTGGKSNLKSNPHLNFKAQQRLSFRPKSLLSSQKKNFQTPVQRKLSDQNPNSDLAQKNSKINPRKIKNTRSPYRKKSTAKISVENQNIQNFSRSESQRAQITPQGSPGPSSHRRFSLSQAWLNVGKVISETFPFEQKSLSAIKPKKTVVKTERPRRSGRVIQYAQSRSSRGKSSWRKVGFSKFKIHNFSQRILGKGKTDESSGIGKKGERTPRLVKTQEIMSMETSQTCVDPRRKLNQGTRFSNLIIKETKISRKSSRQSVRVNNSQMTSIQSSRSQDKSEKSPFRLTSDPNRTNLSRRRKMNILYSKTQKENNSNSKRNLFCTEKDNRFLIEAKEKHPPILRRSTISQMGGSRGLNRSPSSQRGKLKTDEQVVVENSKLAKLIRSGQKEDTLTPMTPINRSQPFNISKRLVPKSISRSKLSHNFISGMKSSTLNYQNSLHNHLNTKSQIRFPKPSQDNFLARLENDSNLGHNFKPKNQDSLSYRLSASICNTRFGETEKFGQMKLLSTFGNRGERLFPILMGGEPLPGYDQKLTLLDKFVEIFSLFSKSKMKFLRKVEGFGNRDLQNIFNFGRFNLIQILKFLRKKIFQNKFCNRSKKFLISRFLSRFKKIISKKTNSKSLVIKNQSNKEIHQTQKKSLISEIDHITLALEKNCLKPSQVISLENTLRSNTSQSRRANQPKHHKRSTNAQNPTQSRAKELCDSPNPKSSKFIPAAQNSKRKDDTVTTNEILGSDPRQNLTQQTEDWYMLSQHYKHLHKRRQFTQSHRDSLYSSAMNSLEVNKTRVANTLCMTRLSKQRSQRNIVNPSQTFYLPKPLQKHAFQKQNARKTRSRASEIKSTEPGLPLSRTLIHKTFAAGTNFSGNVDLDSKRPPFKPKKKKLGKNRRINTLNFQMSKKSISEKFWNEKLTKRQTGWSRPLKRRKKMRSYRKNSQQTNKTNKYISSHSKNSNFYFESDNSLHPVSQASRGQIHSLQAESVGLRSNFNTKATNKNRNTQWAKNEAQKSSQNLSQNAGDREANSQYNHQHQTEAETRLVESKISEISMQKEHLAQSTQQNWGKQLKNSESMDFAHADLKSNSNRHVTLFKSQEHNYRKKDHFTQFQNDQKNIFSNFGDLETRGNIENYQNFENPRIHLNSQNPSLLEEPRVPYYQNPECKNKISSLAEGTRGTFDKATQPKPELNSERHITNKKKPHKRPKKQHPRKRKNHKVKDLSFPNSHYHSGNFKIKKKFRPNNSKLSKTAIAKNLKPLKYTHLQQFSQQKSFRSPGQNNIRKMKSFSPTGSYSSNRLAQLKSKFLSKNRPKNHAIYKSKENNLKRQNFRSANSDFKNFAGPTNPKAEWVWRSKDTEPEASISRNRDLYYPIRTEPSQAHSLDQSHKETQDSQWTLDAESQQNMQFEAYLNAQQLPSTRRTQNFSKANSNLVPMYHLENSKPLPRQISDFRAASHSQSEFEKKFHPQISKNLEQLGSVNSHKNLQKNGNFGLFKKSLPKISEGDVNDSFENTGTVSEEIKRTITEKSKELLKPESKESNQKSDQSIHPKSTTPRTKRSKSKLGKHILKQNKENKQSPPRPAIKLKTIPKLPASAHNSPFSQRNPTPTQSKIILHNNKLRTNLTKIITQRAPQQKLTAYNLISSSRRASPTPRVPKLDIRQPFSPNRDCHPSSNLNSQNEISSNSKHQVLSGKGYHFLSSNTRSRISQNDTQFRIIGAKPNPDLKKHLDGSRVTVGENSKATKVPQNKQNFRNNQNVLQSKIKNLRKLRPLSKSPDLLKPRNLKIKSKFSNQRSLDRFQNKAAKKNFPKQHFLLIPRKSGQMKSFGARLRSKRISSSTIDSKQPHLRKKKNGGKVQIDNINENTLREGGDYNLQKRHPNELYNDTNQNSKIRANNLGKIRAYDTGKNKANQNRKNGTHEISKNAANQSPKLPNSRPRPPRLSLKTHQALKAKSPPSKLHWKLSRAPLAQLNPHMHHTFTQNLKSESSQRDWSQKIRKNRDFQSRKILLKKNSKLQIKHRSPASKLKNDFCGAKNGKWRTSQDSAGKRKLKGLRIIQGRPKFSHARSFDKLRKLSFKRK